MKRIKYGFKVLRTIATLFKEYRPTLFFNLVAFIFAIIGIVLIIPPFKGYFDTGIVEKFPSLIVGCFSLTLSLLNIVTGIILEVIAKKHKQLYELYLNNLKISNNNK